MKRSTERILTTHTGSLPRTDELLVLLKRKSAGEAIDPATFEEAVKASTRYVIRQQYEAGIDVPSTGEQPRESYSTYVTTRMTGFGGKSRNIPIQDIAEFPAYAQRLFKSMSEEGVGLLETPKAIGPVHYTDLSGVTQEITCFQEGVASEYVEFEEEFMTAASPGVVTVFMPNNYYDTHEDYLFTLAEEMQQEYETIVDAGFVLQLDCPDLAMARHMTYKDLSTEEFKDSVSLHVEALNKAVASIPKENIRIHICYGNYEGPHHRDVPLKEIIPRIYAADVGAISIELANPRHAHDYKVFRDHPLPEDVLLIPGVIDVKTNIIEHPEVVADRLQRVAESVGDPTRIIAGTDCGFGTAAGLRTVARDIVWAKLQALAEGANVASNRLY